MSICVIDPIILTVISLRNVVWSIYNNTPAPDVWMPFENSAAFLKTITMQWEYFDDEIFGTDIPLDSESSRSEYSAVDVNNEIIQNRKPSWTQRIVTKIFNTFRQYLFTILLIYAVMFTISSFAVQRLEIQRGLIKSDLLESTMELFEEDNMFPLKISANVKERDHHNFLPVILRR